MKKHIQLLYFVLILFVYNSCNEETTIDESLIKDGSGNIYTEIVIGNQVWLKEDLKTSKYNDEKSIYSAHYKDKNSKGFYYSGSVDFETICPKGYRVPNKYDFEILIEHFGGDDLDKNQMTEAYVNTWNGNPNGNGDGVTNAGSGLYWTSSKDYRYGGYYHFYFRTENAGIPFSVSVFHVGSGYSSSSFHHIKCIKSNL